MASFFPEGSPVVGYRRAPLEEKLLRIKFAPYSDGSIRDLIEVREACYQIAMDTDRILSYTYEDWVAMAAAQRKTPQDLVR